MKNLERIRKELTSSRRKGHDNRASREKEAARMTTASPRIFPLNKVAVKKFPLSQWGRRQCRRGLSC